MRVTLDFQPKCILILYAKDRDAVLCAGASCIRVDKLLTADESGSVWRDVRTKWWLHHSLAVKRMLPQETTEGVWCVRLR